MAVSQFNFNSHPELSDLEFYQTAVRIYYGDPEFDAATDPDQVAQITFIQKNGRYAWCSDALFPNAGNSTNGWFYNLPPWTWLVAIPIVAIVAGILVWNGWGKDITANLKSNGSSGGL